MKIKKTYIILISIPIIIFLLIYFLNDYSAKYIFNHYYDNYTYSVTDSRINIDSTNYKTIEWEIYYLDSHELMWLSHEKLYFIHDSLIFKHTKTGYFGFITPLMFMINCFDYSDQYNSFHKIIGDSVYLIRDDGLLINKGIIVFENGKLIQKEYMRP